MAITKDKKVEILEKLGGVIDKAKSIVFVNFHGLNVASTTELRKNLTQKEVGYTVAKKTLIKKAFDGAKVEGEMPALEGEIALAYGEDALLPAKEVYEFQKKNADLVKIVGGVFEGKFVDAAYMKTIATIPGRETLYAQFVHLINSPLQQFAMAVDQIAKKKEAGS